MVQMIAGALQLDGLAVEKEALVGIEDRRAHAKVHPLGIARLAARFNGDNRGISIQMNSRHTKRLSPCGKQRRTINQGLRRTLGKRVYFNEYRGFESHSLRQNRINDL